MTKTVQAKLFKTMIWAIKKRSNGKKPLWQLLCWINISCSPYMLWQSQTLLVLQHYHGTCTEKHQLCFILVSFVAYRRQDLFLLLNGSCCALPWQSLIYRIMAWHLTACKSITCYGTKGIIIINTDGCPCIAVARVLFRYQVWVEI